MIRRILSVKLPLYAVFLLTLALMGGMVGGAYLWFRPGPAQEYRVFLAHGQSTEELEYGSYPEMSNPSYFEQVKRDFLKEKADFIEADLSTMELTVFKAGELVKKFPILTKGREGSWWETPAGVYRIESRIKNHFSAFAGVYLPWSMPFQGNFFIHGWPYYPDGTPVSSRYSGGCIRLSTEDAKEVFDLVATGIPVLVHERDFARDNFTYRVKNPEFDGRGYLAADLSSNFVFAEKNSTEKMPIASLTKLMTALVAVEYVNIEKEITVTPGMIVPTSVPRLKVGQKISLYNLLPILLMESSNEAAVAISHFLGPQRFVDLMNKKGKAIGMLDTTFTDPAGRSEGNISTARDLLELARYLYNNRTFILKTTKGEIETHVYGPLDYPNIAKFNGFRGVPEFVGGKVGQTEAAGKTILSIFDLKNGEVVRPTAVIILNTPDNYREAEKMIDWTKQNYF
jgi:serine-type D-Ala-D-Ala carboxypeptidase (penicillin-binding protein 5/6)